MLPRAAVFTMLLVGLPGCFPVYSPPIRGLLGGMPDRVARGQLELGGSIGGVLAAPTTGGPHLAYGLSDSLVLEGGANLNFVEGLFATAFAGMRLLRGWALGSEFRLVGDLELGAGGGVGGRAVSLRMTEWASQYAGGFYQGVGAGLRWRFLGLFLRGRLDVSAATLAPSTLWPSVFLGLEARLGPEVVVAVGGGSTGFWNEKSGWTHLWLYQAQVVLVFDLVR